MNATLYDLDRAMHVKIVALSLAASTVFVVVALAGHL